MNVRGWVRTSLIDFPQHIATVLFTAGCNFRCPMCHNADLVLSPQAFPAVPQSTILDHLERRRGKITGVVVTGGEPTLQPDLPAFLRTVRDMGYAIKLDTNGYRPGVLEDLLAAGLLDFVAMDVKGSPATYAALAGKADLALDRIEASLALLASCDVPCELRTTVVPGLLTTEDLVDLASWLSGYGPGPNATYTLQQFRGLRTLDPALAHVSPYAVDTLREMARLAAEILPSVSLRGI
jgi:pyruvate formate lyase activating enzyme